MCVCMRVCTMGYKTGEVNGIELLECQAGQIAISSKIPIKTIYGTCSMGSSGGSVVCQELYRE